MAPIITKTLSTGDADITFMTFDLERRGLSAHLAEALSECDRLAGLDHVARQTFFVSQKADPAQLEPIIEKAYGRPTPVTSYVSQPPAEGHAVSCEMWAFSSQAQLKRAQHVTSASMRTAKWGFVGGMATAEGESPGRGVHRILNEARRELCPAGLAFEQMVRTWYYIGDILGAGEEESRYDQFNASRNEFYRDMWPDLCRSPASTGIGMTTHRVAFEGLLISPEGDRAQISWIDNPLQTPPFLYKSQAAPESNPSFSRAAAVGLADSVLLFISGTASIRGSDVVHPGDAAAQTETTIENIAALIHGGTPRDMHQVRVYVKRLEDFEVVRDCCRAHLPDVPCAYLIADVCRAECLVEIEGVAAFKDDKEKG